MDKGTHSVIYHHRICKHICIKVNTLYMKFCVNFISSITNFFAFSEEVFVDPDFRFNWLKNIFTNFYFYLNTILTRNWEVRVPNNLSMTWKYSNWKIKENSSYMYVLIHQNNSIDFKIKSCFYKIKNDINLWKDSKHINYYIIQTSQSTCKWRNRDDAVVICACNNIN